MSKTIFLGVILLFSYCSTSLLFCHAASKVSASSALDEGFNPLPDLQSFTYFENINRQEFRGAVTLAINCNQEIDPCGRHGHCTNDRCVCDSEPIKGFWSGDDCQECDRGWAGQDCKIECKGGACNRCSGHGDCNEGIAGDGSCRCLTSTTGYWDGADCSVCKSGYFGEKCDKSCPGAEFGSTCWGRGECRANEAGEGVCVCDPGYESAIGCFDCDHRSFGPNCVTKCDGYSDVTKSPCSGHGSCHSGTAKNGTCVCNPTWGLFDCSLQCPGNGCSNHGDCSDGIGGDSTCACHGWFSPPDCSKCLSNVTGPDCTMTCPVNLQTEVPCSGHGECAYVNNAAVCLCAPGYNGTACEISCAGSPPCNGNGNCIVSDAPPYFDPYCSCFRNDAQGYWDGATCEVCHVTYNNSDACTTPCPMNNGKVCSGYGQCFNGLCICERTNFMEYCGSACEIASVPMSFDSNLNCQKCTCVYCNDRFATGNCETQRCLAVTATDPAYACNGRGRCFEGKSRTGVCSCYESYTGPSCEYTCEKIGNLTCGGYGRGVCNFTQNQFNEIKIFCQCRAHYAGKACQLNCPMVGDDVCAGHGVCNNTYLGDATCTCSPGWTGPACNVPCGCNIWNGRCDHVKCAAISDSDVCNICICKGNYTNMCERCKVGTQGRNCEGVCINGNTTGKECSCKPFWSGPACDVPCPVDDVNKTICGGRGDCLWGNKLLGKCKCNKNWYGPNCSSFCESGLCRSQFGLMNPQCNGETGRCECQNDATGHWSGETCEQCVEGYFGTNCEQACVCSNHGGCDKNSGECQCFQSFTRGFYSGQQCDSCTLGYIGSNCERKSVAYTRFKINIDTPTDLAFSPHLFGSIPTTKVMFIDEVTEKAYAGGFPLVQLDSNMSTPDKFNVLRKTSTKPFNNTVYRNGIPSDEDCFDEVAYVFIHEDDIFFLMHPQMQCNLSARVLRQKRQTADLNFSSSQTELIWQMPDTATWTTCAGCQNWGNRTSRVVDATSITETAILASGGNTVEEPLLAFVIAQPVRTQHKVWMPSCIIIRLRINQALSVATRAGAATGKYLNETYEIDQVEMRQKLGTETSGRIMLSGQLVGVGFFDTWEVLEFEWIEGTGFYPEDPTAASLRLVVQCWPQLSNLALSNIKCDSCTKVSGGFYYDDTILLGMNHPDTVFAVWIRPFDQIKDSKEFHAKLLNKCELAKYDITTNEVVGTSTGLQTREFPKKVAFIASAAQANTDIVSMAIDRPVKQLHFCLTVFPTSSLMVKFTFANDDFSILGTMEQGFILTTIIGGAQKAQPETYETLYADSHSRVLYGIHTDVAELTIKAFLLYDTLLVTPDIADQRGGTVIVVNGTGFKQMIRAGTVNTPLFSPKCLFSNQIPVVATDLTPVSVKCMTTAISEADIAESCASQSVEVSLFGDLWFTNNQVALRRVRAARIEGIVNPERGPLAGMDRVSFRGTGFINSPYAVCRFSSNSSTSTEKEALQSRLYYVSRSEAYCSQPPAVYPSPDYSFLDVSLDGQLFMEVTRPFYTIVGPAQNVSAPRTLTVAAESLTQVILTVDIVDRLGHWVGSLDDRSRVICISSNVTEPSECDENALPWRELGDGYPWGPCRSNYYVLNKNDTRCKVVPPNVGRVTWSDFFFVNPRSGTFNLVTSYLLDADRWRSTTQLVIAPGAPYALALSNRRAIAERPNFIKNLALAPAPEIIVLDSLGNKIQNPPATLTVYAQQFFVFDKNGSTRLWTLTEQKKAPDAETVRFTSLFPPFINGATLYINFTGTPNLGLKNTVSPPLRTALCDNAGSQYKVPLSEDCAPCPPEGAVCNGTEIIVVLPGYWRDSSDVDIYKCPGGASVCLGSLAAPNGSECQEGYRGPLCSNCAAGWGKTGSTKCLPCPPIGSSIAITIITAIFLIVALTGWTINVLRQAQVTDLSIILRTVVNHMQATGKLGEFSTQWDPFLKDAFDIQNSASGLSFSGLSSLSCIISSSGSDHEAIFIGYMALPSLTVIMTGLVLLTVRLLKLKPVMTEKLRADVIEEVKNMPSARIGVLLEKYPWYTVATTTTSIFMFTLYQTLITQATSVLTCRKLTVAPGKTKQYLAVDMSIECDDTGDHKFKTAAYLAAIAYGLGIPSAFVFGYRVVLQALGNKDLVNMMFQFLIGGYKPQFWYWQAIIMLRKLVLVLVITFIGENPQLQSYGGMWTMAVALVLQIWFEPNERDVFNRVEALSLAIITITLNLGLLYYWNEMPAFGKNVLTAFLILVTVGVIVMFAYYMYEPIKDTVTQKIAQFKQMIKDYEAAKNAPKDDKTFSLRNANPEYISDDEEDGVTNLNQFIGAGKDKNREFVADFDTEDFGVGRVTAGKSAGGGVPSASAVSSTYDASPFTKRNPTTASSSSSRRHLPILSGEEEITLDDL